MTSSQTPRDVANAAEAAVVSMPQCILARLLDRSFGDDDATETESCDIATSAQYLRTAFQRDYEAAAGHMPDDLQSSADALAKALAKTGETLLAPALSSNQLQAIASDVDAEISPCVGQFLSDLFTNVVAFEKASAKRAQDVDSTALQDIEMIAKKINFIAINASVEAARVGDAGKGFAVIALEIRELSQQASKAVVRLREEV